MYRRNYKLKLNILGNDIVKQHNVKIKNIYCKYIMVKAI